jgi:hypothetical protein
MNVGDVIQHRHQLVGGRRLVIATFQVNSETVGAYDYATGEVLAVFKWAHDVVDPATRDTTLHAQRIYNNSLNKVLLLDWIVGRQYV